MQYTNLVKYCLSSYSGEYSVSGNRFTRSDGQELTLMRSRRAGYPPFYVRDTSRGTFLSSLYDEHEWPEFDDGHTRYRIVRVGEARVLIEALKPASRRRMAA